MMLEAFELTELHQGAMRRIHHDATSVRGVQRTEQGEVDYLWYVRQFIAVQGLLHWFAWLGEDRQPVEDLVVLDDGRPVEHVFGGDL